MLKKVIDNSIIMVYYILVVRKEIKMSRLNKEALNDVCSYYGMDYDQLAEEMGW